MLAPAVVIQDAVADARKAFQEANALFEKTENEKALARTTKRSRSIRISPSITSNVAARARG